MSDTDITIYSIREPLSLRTTNGFIAVTPFERKGVEIAVKSAFGVVAQKGGLVALTVVLPTDAGPAAALKKIHVDDGNVVYVPADCQAHKWASEVHTVGDKTFILLPENFVQLIDRNPSKPR